MTYIKVHKPRMILLENVIGICQHLGGQEPQIHVVYRELESAGYRVHHMIIDSKSLPGPPHRRKRVYIFAVIGQVKARALCEWQKKMSATLKAMQGKPLPMRLFLEADLAPSALLPKQKERWDRTVIKRKLTGRGDVFIDVGKNFCERSFRTVCCLRPSSKPFSTMRKRILNGEEVLALPGIFREDFPSMESDPSSDHFMRDLAGSSFTSSACAAALLCLLTHAEAADPQAHQGDQQSEVSAISVSDPLLVQALVQGYKTVEHRRFRMPPGKYLVQLSGREKSVGDTRKQEALLRRVKKVEQ